VAESLMNDPDYLGTKQPRLTGEEYFKFVDEFVQAVFNRWPNVILQFEDFESLKVRRQRSMSVCLSVCLSVCASVCWGGGGGGGAR
jgi:hypothetical protein